MEKRLEKCIKCPNHALWWYMPSNRVYCDSCVPRGCDCNHHYIDIDAYTPPLDSPDVAEGEEGVDWIWVEKGVSWQRIDEQGREYPCCEYSYDEEGYEIDEPEMDDTLPIS
jgi:hypothetical protein